MAKLSPLQKAYRKYFKEMLKVYNVDSPAQIKPEDKKSEFFNNIKKYWINGEGPKENWKEDFQLAESLFTRMTNYQHQTITVENKEALEESVIKENRIRKYIRTELKKQLNESETNDFDGFYKKTPKELLKILYADKKLKIKDYYGNTMEIGYKEDKYGFQKGLAFYYIGKNKPFKIAVMNKEEILNYLSKIIDTPKNRDNYNRIADKFKNRNK